MKYKLTHVSITDFMRVKSAEMDIDPVMTIVGGDNAQGKSSAIRALICLLFGKSYAPPTPVRKGADQAVVVGTIEGPSGKLTVTWKIKPDRSDTLVIENEDGMKVNTRGTITRLLSEKAIDPLKFTTLTPKERVAEVQKLLGVDFSDLNQKQAQLEGDRKSARAIKDDLEGKYKQSPEVPEDTPDEEVSISGLTNQLAEIEAKLRAKQQAESEAAAKVTRLTDMDATITEAEARLKEMKSRRELFSVEVESAKKLVAEFPAIPDAAPIQAQLQTAEATNANVRAKKARESDRKRWEEAKNRWVELDDAVKANEAEKAKRLASVKWPVPGMSFGETDVELNGLPFEQASSAEQLRASIPLAFTANPDLAFTYIKDGSLLDDSSMKLVAELTEAAGAQLVIERVGSADTGAIIFEDGEIVS
jgi:hypothetical protein